MPLITIFTAPKPFTDPHIATIQRNAILSWLHLGDQVEVLLVGDEPGMQQVAREYRLPQLADVRRNPSATPLVSSIFELARNASQAPILAYLNADILLLPAFVDSVVRLSQQLEQFLLIGQRWDLDVRALLDFSPRLGSAPAGRCPRPRPAALTGWQRLFRLPPRFVW